MADTASKLRLLAPGVRATEVRQPMPSFNFISKEYNHRFFRTQRPEGHNCRLPQLGKIHDSHHWPAFLLTFGLQDTKSSCKTLHIKPKHERGQPKTPDKLLYRVGQRGEAKGSFRFPRGINATDKGDLLVCDTANCRVQVFNSSGVLKMVAGSRGTQPGEFTEPCGAVGLPGGNIAVADRAQRVIHVLKANGQIRSLIKTNDAPLTLACDEHSNLFVATCRRSVEMYKRGGRFVRSFVVGGGTSTSLPLVSLATHNGDHLIVVDAAEGGVIRIVTYEGGVARVLRPAEPAVGLAMQMTAITVDPLGNLLIADGLNHTITVYRMSDGSAAVQQQDQQGLLLGPTDDVGAVQDICITPEGHIAAVEFSANGNAHCVKIFRYLDCACHRLVADDEMKDDN